MRRLPLFDTEDLRVRRTPVGVYVEDNEHAYIPMARRYRDETGAPPSTLTDDELITAARAAKEGS